MTYREKEFIRSIALECTCVKTKRTIYAFLDNCAEQYEKRDNEHMKLADKLTDITSFYMNIPSNLIKSKYRNTETVLCRHVIRYYLHKKIKLSSSNSGYYFDKSDHASVLHSCKEISKILSNKKDKFYKDIKTLINLFDNRDYSVFDNYQLDCIV